MKQNELEILVHKQLTGIISVEEKLLLDQLAAVDRDTADGIANIWEAAEHYTPSVSFDATTGFQNLMSRIEADKVENPSDVEELNQAATPPIAKVVSFFSYRTLSRVAAVVVLGILCSISYHQFTYQTISGGDEGHYASLEDGSSIWLAPHSSIKTKRSFASDRSVELEGKAFFDVYRDVNHPFTISADEVVVTVLGTAFTVDEAAGVVSVKEGKVKVAASEKDVVITANQKVVLTSGDLVLGEAKADEFSWVVPVLSFDNTPLDQVIRELAIHFNTKLNYVGRADLSKCGFTATNLEGATLTQVVSILQGTYDMEVSTDQETGAITFSKVRCR